MRARSLKPFFTYYGGKWRTAKRYPPPSHTTIIEPFAGSAGYALNYPDRKVKLIDNNERVCGVWQYLISARESAVLKLPDIKPGESLEDFDIPQEARWLIGFWLNKGAPNPHETPSTWVSSRRPRGLWCQEVRMRLALQVQQIRHWKVTHGSYVDVENEDATWFIDPPRQLPAHKEIDFDHLGPWCRSRKGAVIVCENEGADWLPFHSLDEDGSPDDVVWTNTDGPATTLDLFSR